MELPDEYYTAEVDPFADTCLGDRGIVYTEWPEFHPDPVTPEDWDQADWDEEAQYGGYVDPNPTPPNIPEDYY